METDSDQRSSAGTSSLLKPVPMYYVDQFQKLYQQSPMAKVFLQGLTVKQSPKKPVSRDGGSRNSTTAKRFKIPLVTPKKSMPAKCAQSQDSQPVEHEKELPKARSSAGPRIREELLTRTPEGSLSSFNSSNSWDSPQDEVVIVEGNQTVLSPQPRLHQGLQRQSNRRQRTPNLHSLIQKLASPDKERTPDEHPRCGGDVVKQGRQIPDDLFTPTTSHHRLAYENEDGNNVSGAIIRTSQAKSRLDKDPEPTFEESHQDNSGAGIYEGQKRSVQQRGLYQDRNLASPHQESKRSTQSSMRDVDGRSNQTPKGTQVLTLSPLVTPEVSEVSLSDETPVNHRSDRLKSRSKGSKRYAGCLIRSLQALEEESLRSEIPYEGRVAGSQETSEDGNDEDDDRMERESPDDEEEESEDEAAEDDLGKRGEDETTVGKEMSETSDPTDVGMEEQVVDNNDNFSLDKPIHEEINDPEEIEHGDGRQRNKSSTSDETPRIPKKKPETIINRWIVKPVPKCEGVCVEGHRVGDHAGQFWHSTAISVRIKPRLLATKSGTLYRLSGKMDRTLAMEQGFSEQFVRSFQKGFPPNWQELLYDHFLDSEKMESGMESNEATHQKEPLGLSPVPILVEQTFNDSIKKVKKKNLVELTPQNLCVKDLHRSSSGRLLKPPLAYWTGQRIRHNTSLDFVEILSGTEDLTSVSASKISLQDSLEIGPRAVRAKTRNYIKKEKAVDTAKQKKHKTQLKKSNYQELESEGDNTTTSCLDTDTDTTVVPTGKSQQHRKSKGNDLARRALRITRNTAASSDNTDAPQDDGTLCSERKGKPKRGQGRPPKQRLAESDSSVVLKPIDESRRGVPSHEIVTMHASSRQDCQKQPPPPRKNRVRKIVDGSTRHPSGAPVSPLYYQVSPGTEEEVAQAKSDFSGKTLNGVEGSSESQGSVDSQVSSDTGLCDEKSVPEVFQSKHPSKANVAPSTLNLQQEILAVVEKHKQGRIAKMRERTVRISASSAERIKVSHSSSTSDVYDLSSDEDNPQRVLFTQTSTTAGESVSNWSEEGEKSVNMTWVTRGKPHRRVYGTLEDPNYNTDGTTTETTTVPDSENPSKVINISSSDDETKCSENSDSLRKNSKKSSGSRSRKAIQRKPVQTSEDDQCREKHVVPLRTSTGRFTSSETSSEDTDDTSKHQKQPVHRGLSKKAVVIQRHQPRRNCQRAENDSETKKTTQNHLAVSKNQAAAWHQKTHSKTTDEVSERDSHDGLSRNRLHQGKISGSPIKTNVMQKGRVQNKKTRDRPSNRTPSVEDGNEESVWQIDEPELSHRPTRLSPANSVATKSTKEQSKQQENQAKTSIALTAKVGTMKRKRQLRDLVEQHNRGYEDDIFESTPFKKQKKLKIPLGEWEIDEEEGPAGKTPGSAKFKTPSIRHQGVLPLSDKKTPYSNLISPSLLPSVDRKHIDQYIHGLQKKKKARGFTQRSFTSNKVGRGIAKSSGSASLTNAMKSKMADMFEVTPVSDSDPDEDQDYYWSDEER
ncbi:uncharacterized protein LOC117293812 [Asterias rubens]|uniref:uncharacterized protein LOC117293812 n=1 Tax=Asterias rubens TaxID=7604 RepID=UPI001454E898|nr:uncharacterized protein LOC117293812 [Asterias rubens]